MRHIKREQVARTAKAMGVSVEVAAAYLNGATVRVCDPKPKLACALLARFNKPYAALGPRIKRK